jgi:hypothetical protein
MNTLLVLTCSTCGQDVDCRIGFSNRTIQPLSFACPTCSVPIGITLDITSAPAFDLATTGAERSERQYAPFDGRNPFVDLHLDFPVSTGAYQIGMTPFFAAVTRIRDEVGINTAQAMQLLSFHNQRLEQLNYFASNADQIRTIIKLYFGTNKQLFKQRVGQLLNSELGGSLEPQDINAALYKFISAVFQPFVYHESVTEFVESTTEMVMSLGSTKPEAFDTFVDRLMETQFLSNLQRDSLGLYHEVYGAELALRPALFLDLLPGADDRRVSGRISAKEFVIYKDLYKDLCEVLGRQLVIVAGINNIIHRDSHDAFAPAKDGAALSSLDKFADKTLSDKFKYLDDCWFNFDRDVLSTGLRNAIAHHSTTYDEVAQTITYFPEKEGIRQENAEAMTFLAFMRLVLQLFREVHYLQHVIKALLYYEIFIRSRRRDGGG